MILNKIIAQKGTTDLVSKNRKSLMKELKTLENPELELKEQKDRASEQSERSDRSTKKYFRSYKGAAKQQWINEMKMPKKWEEGTEPDFTDGHGATRLAGVRDHRSARTARALRRVRWSRGVTIVAVKRPSWGDALVVARRRTLLELWE